MESRPKRPAKASGRNLEALGSMESDRGTRLAVKAVLVKKPPVRGHQPDSFREEEKEEVVEAMHVEQGSTIHNTQ